MDDPSILGRTGIWTNSFGLSVVGEDEAANFGCGPWSLAGYYQLILFTDWPQLDSSHCYMPHSALGDIRP